MADVGRNGREGVATLAICLIETSPSQEPRAHACACMRMCARAEFPCSSIRTKEEEDTKRWAIYATTLLYTGWSAACTPACVYLVAAFCFPDRICARFFGDTSVTADGTLKMKHIATEAYAFARVPPLPLFSTGTL